MDIVKKNLLSIICGVVAVIALVLWFWPLGSIQAEAQTKLEQRTKLYGQMQSALNQRRKLPAVDIQGAEDRTLESFPNKDVIKWGQEQTQKLADEAKRVNNEAIGMNQRALLVPFSLPQPAPTTDFTFRDQYDRVMKNFPAYLHAGQPVAQADIDAAKKEIWTSQYLKQMVPRSDGTEDITLKQQLETQFIEKTQGLADALKFKQAESILLYMAPDAIESSAQLSSGNTGTAPAPTAIWYAQLMLWVQTDIADVILATNSRDGNVIKAPIKNLLKLQIEPYRQVGEGAPNYSISVTGRMSNKDYDVVPIKLVVHAETNRLPAFLEELSRNRFITVTQVNLTSVNSVIWSTKNFVYGSAPVVEATISCEMLMFRDWTKALMPREVKQQLGIEAVAP